MNADDAMREWIAGLRAASEPLACSAARFLDARRAEAAANAMEIALLESWLELPSAEGHE